MQSERPYVSVIVPVYNGEAFLSEAIRSIQKQNYEELEIIIVDDGSTDDTAQIVANLGSNTRYVYQSNSGAAVARNTGLKMAQGSIIGFLDADDLWTENKLDIQLQHLVENPSVEIVLGYAKRMWAERGTSNYDQFTEPELLLSLGSSLVRKTVFKKVGHFDPTLRFCDDWDWFMRARELSVSIITHKEVVLYYRRHENNLTLQRELNDKAFAIILKKSLERRRAQHKGPAKSLQKISNIKVSSVSGIENRTLIEEE